MTKGKVSLAAVGLAAMLSTGCAGTKTGPADAQITTDIQSKLYSDPATRQSSVSVAVKNGAVTLTGDVASSDVELTAMKIANSTPGVQGVADQMRVTSASAGTLPPALSQATAPVAQSGSPAQRAPAQLAGNSARNYPPVQAPPRSERLPAQSGPREAAEAPIARPAEPERVTIAAGDRLSVRTIDAIDSGKAEDGQTFRASLDSPLISNGRVVVPAGAPISLQVSGVKGAGRIKGESSLSLQATSLGYRGRNYPITTSAIEEQGKARGKNTALKTGIGAGVGALIGGLAGGGKGAAIGMGAGGGVGFGANALTHGQQVKIASETVLTFRLESPLVVPAPQ